jgi:hypothetical protein
LAVALCNAFDEPLSFAGPDDGRKCFNVENGRTYLKL